MRLPFTLFLALKYLRPKRTFVSVITVISILGVLLGVAVLVVVLAVMSGFDDMWREKILSFNPHVTVGGDGILVESEALREKILKVEGVRGAAPFVQGLVFLQGHDRVYTPVLRGLVPEYEAGVSAIPSNIVRGTFAVGDEQMVMGRDLAAQMGVSVGDKVLVYSPQNFTSPDELHLPEELEVTGIFDMGMWDFDIGYVLTSLERARELYRIDEGVHGIMVMLKDPIRPGPAAAAIRAAVGPDVRVVTWEEQNRQLFGVLRVEKNMMFLLLIIISVVAVFGITNTLITLAVQKTREIGLLMALGFAARQIMGVFFWQGFIVGLLGTGAGIGAGLLVLAGRNDLLDFLSARFGLELLPRQYYHLSQIPATVVPSDLALVALLVLLMCTLSGWIPAARAAKLDPVKALRYE